MKSYNFILCFLNKLNCEKLKNEKSCKPRDRKCLEDLNREIIKKLPMLCCLYSKMKMMIFVGK